jgi:hypothetical protein
MHMSGMEAAFIWMLMRFVQDSLRTDGKERPRRLAIPGGGLIFIIVGKAHSPPFRWEPLP